MGFNSSFKGLSARNMSRW